MTRQPLNHSPKEYLSTALRPKYYEYKQTADMLQGEILA